MVQDYLLSLKGTHMGCRTNVFIIAVLLNLTLSRLPLLAHHSIAGTYDESRRVTVTGKLVGVDWRNPHVWLHLDVGTAGGPTVGWSLETWGARRLKAKGFSEELFKINDVVTADIFTSKDGSSRGVVRRLTLPDGRVLDGPPLIFTKQ
jgi:hypothetical protein